MASVPPKLITGFWSLFCKNPKRPEPEVVDVLPLMDEMLPFNWRVKVLAVLASQRYSTPSQYGSELSGEVRSLVVAYVDPLSALVIPLDTRERIRNGLLGAGEIQYFALPVPR